MQYLYKPFRDIVPPETAKKWVKKPDGFTILPLVDPNDIISVNGGSPFILERERRIETLDILNKAQVVSSTKKFKVAKAKFNSLSGRAYEYGRCQVTGAILSVNKLEWNRIYDKICLTINKDVLASRTNLTYIRDTKQFIEVSEALRLNYTPYAGEHIRYVSNRDFFDNMGGFVYSDREGRYIETASIVRVAYDERNNRMSVSRYEIRAQEHGAYVTCGNCGEMAMINICDNAGNCIGCVNRDIGRMPAPRPERNEQVYNYTHKVENDLGFDDTGCETVRKSRLEPNIPVYLGMELEYNVRDDMIGKSAKFINGTRYAQCKSDSSISQSGAGAGYEIVTQPCSLTKHKQNLGVILGKFAEYYTAGATCGIHVHVSRKPFNDSDIGKILSFLHREANRDFIKQIARRESHKYARLTDSYIKENKTDPANIKRGQKAGLRTNERERYTALNVKDNTIEFRIFASSTDINVVMAAVQFCEALCMYAKAHSVSSKYSQLPLTKWTDVKHFIEFLKDSNTKVMVTPSNNGKPPIYETTQKYTELEEFIVANKLPTSSKNIEEILYNKVKRSLTGNVYPIPKYRELPTKVCEPLTAYLLSNKALMLRWLHETSDGRGGRVQYNELAKCWQLINGQQDLVYSHEDVLIQTEVA